MASADVATVSKRTVPVPSGYENRALLTPFTRSTATRAAVAQLVHVIPVTSRVIVR